MLLVHVIESHLVVEVWVKLIHRILGVELYLLAELVFALFLALLTEIVADLVDGLLDVLLPPKVYLGIGLFLALDGLVVRSAASHGRLKLILSDRLLSKLTCGVINSGEAHALASLILELPQVLALPS